MLKIESNLNKQEIFFRNENKEICVDGTNLVIKCLKMEPKEANSMAFVKAYFKMNTLTKEVANEIEIGGVAVAQEFVGWIQKFGELYKNDVIITRGGDLHPSMPNLRYIFHINLHTIARAQI